MYLLYHLSKTAYVQVLLVLMYSTWKSSRASRLPSLMPGRCTLSISRVHTTQIPSSFNPSNLRHRLFLILAVVLTLDRRGSLPYMYIRRQRKDTTYLEYVVGSLWGWGQKKQTKKRPYLRYCCCMGCSRGIGAFWGFSGSSSVGAVGGNISLSSDVYVDWSYSSQGHKRKLRT